MLKSHFFNSVKAISFGVVTILILGLVNQLVLIMAAVGYNALMKISPVFTPWSQFFTYSLGGLGFFIVMASAGVVTAMASEQVSVRQVYINTIIAAITGSSISLYLSLQEEIFTLFALIFLLLGIIFSVSGSWFWKSSFGKKKSNVGIKC